MRVVVTKDEVVLREEGGDAFLLHVPTGRYFGLNRSGLVVWDAVISGRDPVQAMAERWPDVERATIESDANRILKALVDTGLARPGDDPAE